jgi:hypothetical protein
MKRHIITAARYKCQRCNDHVVRELRRVWKVGKELKNIETVTSDSGRWSDISTSILHLCEPSALETLIKEAVVNQVGTTTSWGLCTLLGIDITCEEFKE